MMISQSEIQRHFVPVDSQPSLCRPAIYPSGGFSLFSDPDNQILPASR